VDNHYPSLADGRSWLELLTRYDLREVQLPFVLCRKAPQARKWRLVPLTEAAAPLGQAIAVPGGTNSRVWVTIDLARNSWGHIVSTFYKPPIFWLTVATRDGSQSRWRLVPGMARGGFLLSPVVEDCLGFASLAATPGSRGIDLTGKEVVSLTVSADTESGTTALYQGAAQVHFYRLEFPPQDLSRARGFPELTGFFRALQGNKVLRAATPPRLEYLEDLGTVLMAAPDTAIQFTVPTEARKLNVGVGVLSERQDSPRTNAVVFKVSTIGPEGTLAPLWSQRVELANPGAAIRGSDRAEIDLSQRRTTNLVLETISEGQKPGGRRVSYWSEIGFE
jgi:hypothetical protein